MTQVDLSRKALDALVATLEARCNRDGWDGASLDAADAITALRAENEALRAAQSLVPSTLYALATRATTAEAALAAAMADREALIAATLERAAQVADKCRSQNDPMSNKGFNENYRQGLEAAGQAVAYGIRALATQPQTDALAAVRREARAEGMRMAAAVKKTPEFGDDWMGMSCAILTAAEKEENL